MWATEQSEQLNCEAEANIANAKLDNCRPVPRAIRYTLYLNRISSAWRDRMWQFAIGLFFIKLHPDSFLLAAIHGVVNSVAVFITAPIIGKWIERTARMREIQICLFLQNGSVVLSAVFVIIFETQILNETLSNWMCQIGVVMFAIIGFVWSVGFTTCLEKDWLLCIANNEKQLTNMNAVLRRLDLICSLIAPIVVGAVMNASLLWSAVFLAVWNIFSAVFEYSLLLSLYNKLPKLHTEKVKTTKHNLTFKGKKLQYNFLLRNTNHIK